LLALTSSIYANHKAIATPLANHTPLVTPGKVYLGIYGGGGSSRNFNVDQYGTVFFLEATGGPLAVNAFGHANNDSARFVGLQLGYQINDILLDPKSQWSLMPAAELEGFYIRKNSLNENLTNNTERLPEHNFNVTYPTKISVFLANAVFTFNKPCLLVHPYIGFGIGGAIVRITDASAAQTSPPELNINHYNANTSDMDTTFAGQIKLGLSYDINNFVNVFAEYRWLYLSSTDYTFGSTVDPTHAITSSWQVKFDPQRYNLGSIGIRVNL
jgi:opacity protein-like surface antigen